MIAAAAELAADDRSARRCHSVWTSCAPC